MSYQVIARKYRPQRFSDVVGQEHVTQTLSNAIGQNRIAHAYLFCGPRGTGKTTIARIFAKCLNCTHGPKVDFSDDDPRCQEITEGRSFDVFEIDGASNNGVEQVRDLRETCKFAPASSKFKIYIIDEVHMLSTAAFNALLKTLEEPPAHVKFMFATTDPEKVLPTILSRCQRFDLRRIPSALIVSHLAQIARQEKVTIDEPALLAIARGADGGMRDAESALDQLISFCGETIAENDVLSMFGLAAQRQILALADAILKDQPETVIREINELSRHGKDLGRLLADLLGYFRNLLIFQVSRGDLRLLDISETEAAAIKQRAAELSVDALTRIMEVLSDCESRLRDATSKKILVEIGLLNAIDAKNAVSIDSVLKQLNQLRSETGASASPAPRSPSPQIPAASPKHSSSAPSAAGPAPAIAEIAGKPEARAAATAGASQEQLEQLWGNLVEAVGRASPFTKSYLLEAHPVSLEKNILTIGFDPEFAEHLGLVDNAKNHTLLQTKLQELGHPDCRIKFIQAEAPAQRQRQEPETKSPPARAVTAAPASVSAPQPAISAAPAKGAGESGAPVKPRAESAPAHKEDFKNDPLIKKALEVFKGQIVDIRS